jgi:phosphohistidine phosphatase SixA
MIASVFRLVGTAVFCVALTGAAHAATLSGQPLMDALGHGGYVLLMRHASSPATPPDKTSADKENVALERQLDQAGRDSARQMGEAVKTLRVPIGQVSSSPTYRALQTVQLAGLGKAATFPELGDGGQNMQTQGQGAGAWLRGKVAEAPRAGTNTILVTHLPNITAAFGNSAPDVKDGESLVFRPDGKGGAELVGRIRIEEWPMLASASTRH